jgi:hypothetical protein
MCNDLRERHEYRWRGQARLTERRISCHSK